MHYHFKRCLNVTLVLLLFLIWNIPFARGDSKSVPTSSKVVIGNSDDDQGDDQIEESHDTQQASILPVDGGGKEGKGKPILDQ